MSLKLEGLLSSELDTVDIKPFGCGPALGNVMLGDDDLASFSIKSELTETKMDPFPTYSVLDYDDSEGMGCFSGRSSQNCQMCSPMHMSCSPSSCSSSSSGSIDPSLPQLDWIEVQSQLTCDFDLDDAEQLPCLSMNEVCGIGSQTSSPLVNNDVLFAAPQLVSFEQEQQREEACRAAASLRDKVLFTDCMLSSSSEHQMNLSPRSRCLSNTALRPDTPLSEPEAPAHAGLSGEELLSDVISSLLDPSTGSPPLARPTGGQPTPACASVRIISRAVAPAVTSSRSLLKRSHQRICVPSQQQRFRLPAGVNADAGDHSYSAATQQQTARSGQHSLAATHGAFDSMLTPSPSQSEHSSDDETDVLCAVDETWCRRKRMRYTNSVYDRLQSPPTQQQQQQVNSPRFRLDDYSAASSAAAARTACPPERRHSQPLAPTTNRHNHNSMERMRRDLLRDYLHALRCLVPVTAANERAPKVTVLREAAKFCLQLRAKEEQLATQKRQLQLENSRLLRQLRGCQQLPRQHSRSGVSVRKVCVTGYM